MPTVVIEISPAGESQLQVQGMTGPGCTQLTAALERAIGQTTQDTATPEMHQRASAPQTRELPA